MKNWMGELPYVELVATGRTAIEEDWERTRELTRRSERPAAEPPRTRRQSSWQWQNKTGRISGSRCLAGA
ncbi:MAG: hypothetical protein INR71_16405 [Terriglobus roseus]|nr:hypothetical protein [Terriglobus roseus]